MPRYIGIQEKCRHCSRSRNMIVTDPKKKHLTVASDRSYGDDCIIFKVVKKHGEALKRFLASRLPNRFEREDIEQDVYIRLARQNEVELKHKLSISDSSTRSYLFSIATNLIIDRYKRPAEKLVVADDGLETQDLVKTETLENLLVINQEISQLRRAIVALSPECRNAFVLSRFHAKSYREIATTMNVSVSMVEKYMMKALSEIKQSMQSNDN